MWRQGIPVVVACAIVAVLAGIFLPPSGLRETAHEATRLHLKFLGSGIYEYRARTGSWPTRNEDLAKSSLPQESPYWRQMLDDEVNVIVWHKALKPDPRDNADQILAYHNKGLIATSGRSWVCWGDLRTEYIKTEDLRAYLNNLKE